MWDSVQNNGIHCASPCHVRWLRSAPRVYMRLCECVFVWAVASFCHLCAGMNDSDVNQNKNRSNKSETTSGSAPTAPPSTGPASRAAEYCQRPHLVRLFSRDAPGREDNTFKERPSESDELHTIEEAVGATSENAEWKQKNLSSFTRFFCSSSHPTWHLQAQQDSPVSDSGVGRKTLEWWIRLGKSLEEIRSGRARWEDVGFVKKKKMIN